ncbi:MAG: hypothetical protein IJJ00_08605 [Erysipelotrichaceae bacterium]|nr:hypothetical protein [Erysipelotrichaceae bacterium]
MKKLLVLLMVLCLCACGSKQVPEPEPEPEPDPQEPVTIVIKEKEYVLPEGFVTYDFAYDGQLLTYKIKDGLTLKLSGEEKEDSACNGKCTLFNEVTANGKHLSLLEKSKLNDKVGHMYLYDLNGELYLICLYPTNSYDKANCVVFDSEGNTVAEWENVVLTMNTEMQNEFLIDYADGSSEIVTAEGKTLDIKSF